MKKKKKAMGIGDVKIGSKFEGAPTPNVLAADPIDAFFVVFASRSFLYACLWIWSLL